MVLTVNEYMSSFDFNEAYLKLVFQQIIGEHNFSDEILEKMYDKFVELYNSGILPKILFSEDNKELFNDISIGITATNTSLFPSMSVMEFVNPIVADQKVHMFIPCKYNTFQNDNVEILSNYYHYANTVSGPAICSHSQVIAKADHGSVSYCSYMHDHASCPHYAVSIEVLRTSTVKVDNTLQTNAFELTYAPIINFFENQYSHVFSMNNKTDDSVVNELVFNVDSIGYEEAKAEAELMFDEYMNVFSSSLVTNSHEVTYLHTGETRSESPKSSYFDHILSLS